MDRFFSSFSTLESSGKEPSLLRRGGRKSVVSRRRAKCGSCVASESLTKFLESQCHEYIYYIKLLARTFENVCMIRSASLP